MLPQRVEEDRLLMRCTTTQLQRGDLVEPESTIDCVFSPYMSNIDWTKRKRDAVTVDITVRNLKPRKKE